jgi:hypothetical protein
MAVARGMRFCDPAILEVKFVLDDKDFFKWSDVLIHCPNFKKEHITGFEKLARERKVEPSLWRCRINALPLDRILGIEIKSKATNTWVPFDKQTKVLSHPDIANVRAITIGNYTYYSQKDLHPSGQDVYGEPMRISNWHLERALKNSATDYA